MGVNLKDLVEKKRILSIEELRGKIISIDAYNALYQFLAIIRQPNGTPLMDSSGRITSHLNGLLYRTINFLEYGIKPVYVFDGKPPEIKKIEILRRTRRKEEAVKKYEEALKRGDLQAARIYAQQTSRLTEDMVNDAKKLLSLLGVPWVQAPSEGEAQAAYLVIKGDAWGAASQDYDALLYGAPRLVRNLTISGRRKLPRKDVYIEIKPELIVLTEVLKSLGITREQLIDIAILIGTDYNPEGVPGIGPKKALKIIKEFKSLENAMNMLPSDVFPVDPSEIKKVFLNPPVTDNYELEWHEPDFEGIMYFLCDEHDFSRERVRNALKRAIKAVKEIKTQKSLDSWFG
ncbi:MAG: flap endonuclease-1 [Thermoproteales archaeon]|nr:flap endonuclease-1 [Thermoproteales archaeon]RLE66601.1 MAG: flap endonuclease-1 [Thermoprotei archaeon]